MTTPQRVALVTGASAGIGRATALALGRAGYSVGVCARRPGPLADVIAELRAEGIDAAGQPCDVSDPDGVRALVDHVESRLGPADVLVNNAGVGILKPFSELTLEDWDTTFASNVRSLFVVTQAVLSGMRQRQRGFVINVSSLAGRNGFKGGTAYAASKHAVLGFSSSLLAEVRHDGVRVLTVCPGSVDTDLRRDQHLLGEMPPERMLRSEDVAAVIIDALSLPDRALVSELDIRPAAP
ncbi:MAG: SDR family NAD(P)-dependent oxidoreductase [Gemmatimonadales bacterium]|nr:SDR family NAD(P)-dependent oxidoreductase [Gemmatimonadales bacterium]